ncbi:hypothetical protein R5W24_006218 [Gemmata sp. JC717]|uniref:hypothetical protein n=1 Tax=Gemmata algarum TaxID=2975278 RepID=UPI0021BB3422|nr:hypothetical protein [Gemmata algarum]MDY3557034.1 hypothetical protein [Gemmata algarum]
MSDASPEPALPPAPAPEPLPAPEPPRLPPPPWWLPGLALGLVAALVMGLVSLVDAPDEHPSGAYRATARVLLRPPPGEPAVSDAERQRAAFLFRDRALLTRALEAPDAPDESGPAVLELERRLTVEAGESSVVTVRLFGDAPDELGARLDRIVARFVEELATRDHKTRNERVSQLEQAESALQSEIKLQEKTLKVVSHASGGGGAALREQLVRAETDLARTTPERLLLEYRAEALKKRRADGGSPDPVEALRLVDADPRVAPLLAQRATAAVALEKERATASEAALKELQAKLNQATAALTAARLPVRKEVDAILREADTHRAANELADTELRLAVARAAQEGLRQECDGLRKELAAAHVTGAAAESVRRELAPLQQHLDKIGAQLAQLRADGLADGARARPAGPAVVDPVRRPWRGGLAFGAAVRAFAVAFVLATAFQLTGLVFHALRPR